MFLFLACIDSRPGAEIHEGDTGVVTDSGGEEGLDTDHETLGTLDLCAAAGVALTEDWTGRVEGADAPGRIAWHDGLLAMEDSHSTLVVVAIDGTTTSPEPIFSSEVFDVWTDLYFRDDGLLVAGMKHDMEAYWPREWERAGHADAPGAAYLEAVAPAPEGARAVSADGIFAYDPEQPDAEIEVIAAPFARPLVATGREGTAHSRGEAWVAGTDESGAPMLGYDDGTGGGYASVTPFPSAFGDPVSVVLVPGGGVLVAGGPGGYGWFARVDGGGVLTAFVQVESPGISRLRVSEGSAFGWTSFDGMGVFATHLDAPDYRLLTEEADVVDLVVDPAGEWLLTASGDGTLRRWTCAVEG